MTIIRDYRRKTDQKSTKQAPEKISNPFASPAPLPEPEPDKQPTSAQTATRPTEFSTGKIDIKAAVDLAWEQCFKNPGLAILAGLGVMIAIVVINFLNEVYIGFLLQPLASVLPTVLGLMLLQKQPDFYYFKLSFMKFPGLLAQYLIKTPIILCTILPIYALIIFGIDYTIIYGLLPIIGLAVLIYLEIFFWSAHILYLSQNRGPMQSLKLTWLKLRPFFWKLLLTLVLMGLINIPGLLALGLGILIAFPISCLLGAIVVAQMLKLPIPAIHADNPDRLLG